jgi:DNA modification methylase
MSEFPKEVVTDKYMLFNADSCEILLKLPSESIHYSIFSSPFVALYSYTNSDRDLGNCRGSDEFFEHFSFIGKELYRVLKPGRLLSFHCMTLPLSKEKDGVIGLYDFRGDMIRFFQNMGFIYHSEVCIYCDPVVQMQRTKALGLLHKQLKKDSAMSRQGLADYLVTMRKPGDNPEPITHTNQTFPVSMWQHYADPVWMDIKRNDTLQYQSAREEKDERHICPTQLTVLQRGIELWSAPGETVLTPFLGIGSEAYMAVKMGRKAVGIELKESYFKQAVANVKSIAEDCQQNLFE